MVRHQIFRCHRSPSSMRPCCLERYWYRPSTHQCPFPPSWRRNRPAVCRNRQRRHPTARSMEIRCHAPLPSHPSRCAGQQLCATNAGPWLLHLPSLCLRRRRVACTGSPRSRRHPSSRRALPRLTTVCNTRFALDQISKTLPSSHPFAMATGVPPGALTPFTSATRRACESLTGPTCAVERSAPSK